MTIPDPPEHDYYPPTCHAVAYRKSDGWQRHWMRCDACGINVAGQGKESAARLADDHNTAAAARAALTVVRDELRCDCWASDAMEQSISGPCARCRITNALENTA